MSEMKTSQEDEKVSKVFNENENLIYMILMIIGSIGFALKFAVQIMDFFVWLIISHMVFYVMMAIGLFGFVLFIIRNPKNKNYTR